MDNLSEWAKGFRVGPEPETELQQETSVIDTYYRCNVCGDVGVPVYICDVHLQILCPLHYNSLMIFLADTPIYEEFMVAQKVWNEMGGKNETSARGAIARMTKYKKALDMMILEILLKFQTMILEERKEKEEE